MTTCGLLATFWRLLAHDYSHHQILSFVNIAANISVCANISVVVLSFYPQPIKVDNSILIQFHFFFLHTFVPDWQAKIEGAFDSTYTQSKHMVEIKLILNNYEFGVMIMTRVILVSSYKSG